MKRFIFLLTFCLPVMSWCQDETSEKLAAQSVEIGIPYPLITNIPSRASYPLNGTWNAIVDQYDNGYYNYRMRVKKATSTFFADRCYSQEPTSLIEYDFDKSGTLEVPGDWNTQRERLYYYEGTIWYRMLFDFTPKEGYRYFVHFGAANYEALVGMNGKILGRHIGGFTPFNFEITDILRSGSNSLIVKVNNNRHEDAVPTINCDWWNFGGITRDVQIVQVPETFVRNYKIALSVDGKRIEGEVVVDGQSFAGQKLTLSIPELDIRRKMKTDARGTASFSIPAAVERWSPDNPKLYEVILSAGNETIHEQIGFRTIATRGAELLLNEKPVFCKGIAIHEETMDDRCGRAWSPRQSRDLLMAAKALGCNFVRLAHYPHNENMTRLADSLGLMVWSEIPVYWTISWTNKPTFDNARTQLQEMICRDYNRASIVVWSVANETPRSEERAFFLSSLMDTARSLDATRLVSCAMEKVCLKDGLYSVRDELIDKVDLLSFNEYIGWYDGKPEKCARSSWTFPIEKPVIVTELGAGVKYGYHADESIVFSEEYAVEVYKAQLEMLSRMPGLAGICPWILKDFRSPRRQLCGIQDDFNRKGLLSEIGERKDAWYVLHDWYVNHK